ncbi:hypothetical protein GCM10009416_47570 [Craurococcus roseus]|uniref:DUF5666 domain-containing protein n=1 Tax=Craurococcus roseus TaxID=77585 RepID=A0ABN1G5X8_9PROT
MRETFLSTAATGCLLFASPAATPAAMAQPGIAPPGIIIGSDEVTATVETVGQRTRMVLLRGPTGGLLTVHAGQEARNLPRVRPGDRVVIRHGETIAVQIARPGEPPAGGPGHLPMRGEIRTTQALPNGDQRSGQDNARGQQ